MAVTYVYETDPFEHQSSWLDAHAFDLGTAIWWEQGTGKSKGLADNAAVLYEAQHVGGLFLLGPNGVHRNFITKEMPKHWPKRHALESAFFRTDKSSTKWHQKEIERVIGTRRFACMSMSYDGIMTEPGRKAAKAFLQSRPCLYALDESQRVASPSTSRTIRVLASGPYAKWKRILTGTPMANKPWDVYTQIKFIDPGFWRRHDLDDYQAIKTRFGVWDVGYRWDEKKQIDVKYPVLTGFKDLHYLREILEPIRSRVTKDVLNLPPKLYSQWEFELTAAQRKAYDELVEQSFTIVDGELATVKLALTLMLRLQQITCGYLPIDIADAAKVLEDPDAKVRTFKFFDPNPRLVALNEIAEDISHQAIVWGRFRQDIDVICELLKKRGDSFVRYDGAVDDDSRARAIDQFQAGDAKFFVGNPSVGSEGITLTNARTVVYYSNSFKLIERLQSEDRAHRFGTTNAVNYIDLMAVDSLDVPIQQNLVGKHDAAAIITGDRFRKWIRGDVDGNPEPRTEAEAKDIFAAIEPNANRKL